MGKLVRMVIVLVVLAAGVLLFLQYSGGGRQKPTNAGNTPAAKAEKSEQDKPQVQEKYGIAPVGDGVAP
jgi:hypothetical protein